MNAIDEMYFRNFIKEEESAKVAIHVLSVDELATLKQMVTREQETRPEYANLHHQCMMRPGGQRLWTAFKSMTGFTDDHRFEVKVIALSKHERSWYRLNGVGKVTEQVLDEILNAFNIETKP